MPRIDVDRIIFDLSGAKPGTNKWTQHELLAAKLTKAGCALTRGAVYLWHRNQTISGRRFAFLAKLAKASGLPLDLTQYLIH